MSAQILDGRALALQLKEQLVHEIKACKDFGGEVPRIVSIVVGDDPASLSYVSSQQKAAQSLGLHYELQNLQLNAPQDSVLNLIEKLNTYDHMHGILINKPLPVHMDFQTIINAIVPDKDIEGVNLVNMGRLFLGQARIVPCTPAAALALLKSSNEDLKGKHAVVIGRSEIVGKPMAMLLLKEEMTVTICHSKTSALPDVVRQADVVVAAVGRPLFVRGDWIKPGAVVIDVGINQLEGKITGDVDFKACKDKAAFITPVPGGVGPVTSVMLMKNVIEAFKIQCSL